MSKQGLLHSVAMVTALNTMSQRHLPIARHPESTTVQLHAMARTQRAYMDRGMTAEQAAWNARIDRDKAQARARSKVAP